MDYDPTNLHAMILRGELERTMLVDNDHALAFAHPCPRAETHVVLLAKGEFTSLEEFSTVAPMGTVVAFWRTIAEVSKKLGLQAGDYRLVVDSAEDAEARHFHLHMLAGPEVDPGDRIDPDELVALLLPLEGEPKPEHVKTLVDTLELSDYDARRCLGSGLPWALRKGSPAESQTLLRALKDSLPVGCVQTYRLIETLDPWVVEWMELVEEGLVMVGGEGSVPLVLGGGALLVRGRYTSRAGGSKAKPVPFAHLYYRGHPRPFAFIESEIRDYAFLREDMAPSRRANFDALMGILSDQPQVQVVSTPLDADPAKVQAAVGVVRAGIKQLPTTSSDANAELLSRLIYYSVF